MRIILATGEEHSSCLIQHLKLAGHQIVGVIFPANTYFNRGGKSFRESWFNFRFGKIQTICRRDNIPHRVETNLKDGSLLTWIKELYADLLLVLSWPKHIPRSFLSLFKHGGMNIHPSTLPKLKGSDPVFSAVLNDEPGYGISFHRVESKMDSGNLYLQKPLNRDSSDNYERLYFRFMREAGQLAPMAIDRLLHSPNGKPQIGETTLAKTFELKHTIYSSDDSIIQAYRKCLACRSHHYMKALCGKTLIRFNRCSLQVERSRINCRKPTILSVGFRSVLIGHGSRKLLISGVTIAGEKRWLSPLSLFLVLEKGQTLASGHDTLLFLKEKTGAIYE